MTDAGKRGSGTVARGEAELVRGLLDDLSRSFDLSYPVGGERLGDRIAARLRGLSERPMPEWGSPGPPTEISSADSPHFRFYYAPHLFPGMEAKLRLAHKLQFFLLPRQLPEGSAVEVAAVLESYCHLSGDLFGWRRDGDGGLLLWVVDVSGHGVRSGLASAVLRILIEHAESALEIEALVDHLNRSFLDCRNPEDRPLYATGFFLRLAADGEGRYSSAGHPPGLLWRPGGALDRIVSTDRPIGLFDEETYRSAELSLGVDDTLLLYTDGVVEATGRDGEEFGHERLESVVRRDHPTPQELAGAIYREIVDHQAIEALEDDVTFLALRRIAS